MSGFVAGLIKVFSPKSNYDGEFPALPVTPTKLSTSRIPPVEISYEERPPVHKEQDLSSELKSLEDQIFQLERQKNGLEEENQKLRAEGGSLRNQIVEIQSKREDGRKTNEKMRSQYELTMRALQSEREQTQHAHRANQNLQMELEDSQQLLQQALQTNEKLRSQCERDKQVHQEQIRGLQAEMDAMMKDSTNLRQQLHKIHNSTSVLNSKANLPSDLLEEYQNMRSQEWSRVLVSIDDDVADVQELALLTFGIFKLCDEAAELAIAHFQDQFGKAIGMSKEEMMENPLVKAFLRDYQRSTPRWYTPLINQVVSQIWDIFSNNNPNDERLIKNFAQGDKSFSVETWQKIPLDIRQEIQGLIPRLLEVILNMKILSEPYQQYFDDLEGSFNQEHHEKAFAAGRSPRINARLFPSLKNSTGKTLVKFSVV